jgi:hypothetical protein
VISRGVSFSVQCRDGVASGEPERMARGCFFEYPGAGHGVSVVPGCPFQMFPAFLADPSVSPDGVCIGAMDAPAGP